MPNYTVVTHKFLHSKTGLTSLANHYLPLSHPNNEGNSSPLSLVFAHGTSNHKEQWEPIIDYLFKNSNPCGFREAWALDWQNHGQSALLNKARLQSRDAIGIEEYGDLLREFIESPHVRSKHIVAVGHSGSTAAWTLAVSQSILAVSPVKHFILFEPVHVFPPIVRNDKRLQKGFTNVQGVKARKTTFSSYDEVEKMVRKRYPWKAWDKRVQDAYLQFGITAGEKKGEVTTCCTAAQEVWNYEPYVYILVGNLYAKLCANFDVHIVFGERLEMHFEDTKLEFSDGVDGRSPASVQTLPQTGHLLVQEKPDECAQIMLDILSKRQVATKSHL